MAEKFRFFDAVQDEFGVYDREYNAQEFTDYFKALVTTGIMKGAGNQLAVSTNGSSMVTSINTGIAFLLGRYYENDSPLNLTHDTETLGNSRIDRIVIRMDLNTNARYVRAFIKKGVPSANPVAPTLTQTANLYEISLAQVRVVGGQTFIATNAITDERGTDVICPWAGSNILPNYDNDYVLTELEGKADKLVDGPYTPTLSTGHSYSIATAVNPPIRYFKDSFGFVHVYGVVMKVVGGSTTMFSLPVGYRPFERTYSLVQTTIGTTNSITILNLNTTGAVQLTATTTSEEMTVIINAHFKAAE